MTCSEFYTPLQCNSVMHLDGNTLFVVVSNKIFLVTSFSLLLHIKSVTFNLVSATEADLYSQNQEPRNQVLTNL